MNEEIDPLEDWNFVADNNEEIYNLEFDDVKERIQRRAEGEGPPLLSEEELKQLE